MSKVKQLNPVKNFGTSTKNQDRIYDPNGDAPCLNATSGGSQVPKIKIKSATKQGYEEARGGGFC